MLVVILYAYLIKLILVRTVYYSNNDVSMLIDDYKYDKDLITAR